MTVNKFPYQDKGLVNATQLGAVDPSMIGRSEVPTSMPLAKSRQHTIWL